MSFTKATRTAKKARIALCGPSGSGKTYTALAVAHGLGKRIAVIDTERHSASMYADVNGWSFDIEAPASFSPDALTALLAEAAAAGYDVVIVDSLSHYWMGTDGMLEQVDRRAHGANSFSGWKDARPLERRMVDALVAYPGHVIVTMRTKTEYVIEEDSRGKKVPRKVGMKPEQREGIEYEFDVVGDLDHANTLTVSKTRIPSLAQGVVPKPGVEFAEKVTAWLGSGEAVPDALAIRERVLAETDIGALTAIGAQVSMLGIGNAAVTDVDGNPTSLVDLVRDRWRALHLAQQEQATADSSAPATEQEAS